MSEQRTFNEWEKEEGCLVVGATDEQLNTKMTKEEFDAIVYADGKFPHGVNWVDRTKFLEDNGYEVTRENMVDSSLSAKKRRKA